MAAQGFCIGHVNSFADAHRNVDGLGAKVMEGVGDKPLFVDPGDVGVFVFQSHWDNGKPFFSTGVEHAWAVVQQFRAFVGGSLWKDDDAHAFLQSVADRRPRRTTAVFAFSVHPNGAQQRGAPADDGP